MPPMILSSKWQWATRYVGGEYLFSKRKVFVGGLSPDTRMGKNCLNEGGMWERERIVL